MLNIELSLADRMQGTLWKYSLPHPTPTSWSRVLEKLTVSQLLKKFPAFYGT
jgi:hypothetical protein